MLQSSQLVLVRSSKCIQFSLEISSTNSFKTFTSIEGDGRNPELFAVSTISHFLLTAGQSPRYRMQPPYGTALVINVKSFHGKTKEGFTLEARRGSNIDVEKWRQMWESIDFVVKEFEDFTAREILKGVKDMADGMDEKSSCFVCLITTHGHKGKLYGSDSDHFQLEEITNAFKKDKCPGLEGKPKLFFILAGGIYQNISASSTLANEVPTSRPVSRDTVLPVTGSGDANARTIGSLSDSPVTTTDSTNEVMQSNVDYDGVNDTEFRKKLDPYEPDFLIAISLAPGKLKLTAVLSPAITYGIVKL